MKIKQVIILGAGPAGLSAALYLARAGLSPLVFGGSPPGGQLTLTSHVENFPGVDTILGPELIAKMRQQARKFGTEFIDENAVSISKQKDLFCLEVASKKEKYFSRSVLIATGAEAQWLGLESETRLRGRGVSACATCDGFFFRDKIVAVVGGGDTAMEEAITLTKFAKKVYIIHRRDSFRASKIMQDRVFANPKIEILWNSNVKEIVGNEKVEGVVLVKNNTEESLAINGIFIAIGHKPTTYFIGDSDVLLDEKGYILTSGTVAFKDIRSMMLLFHQENEKHTNMKTLEDKIKKFNFDYQYMTSVDGLFAAGDVIDPHYRQASTAAGMGVAASLEIERWLSQKK